MRTACNIYVYSSKFRKFCYLLEDRAFSLLAGFSSSRNQLHWRLEVEDMSIWWIPRCSLTFFLNCYFLVPMRLRQAEDNVPVNAVGLICWSVFPTWAVFLQILILETLYPDHRCCVMTLAIVIDKTYSSQILLRAKVKTEQCKIMNFVPYLIHVKFFIFFLSCLYFKGAFTCGAVVACAYKVPTLCDSFVL